MGGDQVPDGPHGGLFRGPPLDDTLDVHILDVASPLQGLVQIGALGAAVDKAMGGVVFDAQPGHFAEHQLPLLRGADVVAAHHAVDDGALHPTLRCCSHHLVEHLDGGGDVLVVGEFLHIGHTAQVVLGPQVLAEIHYSQHVFPLLGDDVAVLVQDAAGPAAHGAHFHAGALAGLFDGLLAGCQFLNRKSEKILWVAVKLHKFQPQIFSALQAGGLGGHDNPQFHSKFLLKKNRSIVKAKNGGLPCSRKRGFQLLFQGVGADSQPQPLVKLKGLLVKGPHCQREPLGAKRPALTFSLFQKSGGHALSAKSGSHI